jgi:hypothetical protein
VPIQTPTNPSVSDQDLHQVLLFLYLLIIADIKLLVSKHKQSHRSFGSLLFLSFEAAGRLVLFP